MNLRVIWLLVALGACNHQGRLRVDTPIAPYQKPDISEITGIDEDEQEAAEKTPAPAPAPAPGKPAAPPAGK
jgi:hypothetical protein